ncbi:hypothetical protein Bcav_2514 [Beutenbergia cavernae DSM 12333]|uniref:Uncharacterized protein n=1 Tax=Beutenbergia cavernae (strain ATCC BAA-8 / DSM 12333 / CCUG 43141 / JCM 11478 / NBRC 16432 / NCIMB 13614 / HKI 0122) TaxID=471853 RepID=C5BWU7_BEUC1|nr:hypothetical protein [Beutenbergia cavernae]ACQ80763.1 hypothetical protein Bcav_2514 [Beutenbergia cavernae DSM 12333]
MSAATAREPFAWDGVLWVCMDCMLTRETGEPQNGDREPWSTGFDGVEVAHGVPESEHTCGHDGVTTECGCAVADFATAPCDACGTWLAGERHAYAYRLTTGADQ